MDGTVSIDVDDGAAVVVATGGVGHRPAVSKVHVQMNTKHVSGNVGTQGEDSDVFLLHHNCLHFCSALDMNY